VSITLGVYSHVAPTLHDDAASTVAALMRGKITRIAVDGGEMEPLIIYVSAGQRA
jgi:hypothetical protein